MMLYQDVTAINRKEATEIFDSGNTEQICNALIRITYHDPDWRWVQEICLEFTKHQNANIRGLALTCLGHLARIHGRLDLHKVQPILKDLLDDLEISGYVEDVLDDIKIFLKVDLRNEQNIQNH